MERILSVQCPVCDVTLQIAERQGIEIDYCPQCRGVWLDRGELDKIIERANSGSFAERSPTSTPYPEKRKNDQVYEDYDESDYDREHDRRIPPYDRRRKKSFLDDIFDIFD
jgi:Zn-finger nucleic acid-binding protein